MSDPIFGPDRNADIEEAAKRGKELANEIFPPCPRCAEREKIVKDAVELARLWNVKAHLVDDAVLEKMDALATRIINAEWK